MSKIQFCGLFLIPSSLLFILTGLLSGSGLLLLSYLRYCAAIFVIIWHRLHKNKLELTLDYVLSSELAAVFSKYQDLEFNFKVPLDMNKRYK